MFGLASTYTLSVLLRNNAEKDLSVCLSKDNMLYTFVPFLSERVWNLYHNWRLRGCWDQRKCLHCTWGEERPIKRICNGELFKEEEVLAVGIWCKINSVSCNLFAWKSLKKCAFSPSNSPFTLCVIIPAVPSTWARTNTIMAAHVF